MTASLRLALGTASALGLGRFAYGLILPAMAERLHWDLARAGGMTTANGFGYLAGALVTTLCGAGALLAGVIQAPRGGEAPRSR